MGNGGVGIGDWGLGPIPNPQSPIPNPQSPIPNPHLIKHVILIIFLILNINIIFFLLNKILKYSKKYG